MTLTEPGRVCIVLKGADTGKEVVIKEVVDKNFVLITGAGMSKVKRRRVNTRHLEPLGIKLEISRGASDDEVRKTAETAKLDDELKTPFTLSL